MCSDYVNTRKTKPHQKTTAKIPQKLSKVIFCELFSLSLAITFFQSLGLLCQYFIMNVRPQIRKI